MFKFDDMHPVTKGTKSFIPRDGELTKLFCNIFEAIDKGNEKVNYSITGINRIGKTSIVKELCRRFDENPHPNTFVLFTSLEGIEGFWPFWCGKVIMPLIKKLDMDEVKNFDEDYYDKIVDIRSYFENRDVLSRLYAERCDSVEHAVAKGQLELLLSLLGYCEKRFLLIIDEFDYAPRAFGENDSFFDWLRGLLQDEKHPLSVVTISRRSIYYIETNAFGGSTLSGTFKHFWVFGYKNSEIEKYFELLEENGCSLPHEKRREIIYYCGRSPYYLAIMGNAILEAKSDPHIEQLFKNERRYYDSFGRIVEVLKDEKLYATMLQLFVGPQYDMDQEKITELIGNGYCMSRNDLWTESLGDEYHDLYGTYEEEYSYLTICNSFIDYLTIRKKRDVDNIFPRLSQAEKQLRHLIRKHMEKQYQESWKDKIRENLFNGVLKDNKMRRDKLEQYYARYLRQCEEADNSADMDESMLDVISIFELGAVIRGDWDYYKDVLPSKMRLRDFEEGISLLNKVRNPVAHGNGKIVPHDMITRAGEFSDEIIHALKDMEDI